MLSASLNKTFLSLSLSLCKITDTVMKDDVLTKCAKQSLITKTFWLVLSVGLHYEGVEVFIIQPAKTSLWVVAGSQM